MEHRSASSLAVVHRSASSLVVEHRSAMCGLAVEHRSAMCSLAVSGSVSGLLYSIDGFDLRSLSILPPKKWQSCLLERVSGILQPSFAQFIQFRI